MLVGGRADAGGAGALVGGAAEAVVVRVLFCLVVHACTQPRAAGEGVCVCVRALASVVSPLGSRLGLVVCDTAVS